MSFASTVSCRMRQMIYRLNRRDRKAIRQSSEEGPGSVFAAAQILRSNRLKKPLVVIGSGAEELKDRLVRSLEESDFTYVLWEDLPACPTEEDVDSLRLAWIREVCDCFVVMGDGAAITAKYFDQAGIPYVTAPENLLWQSGWGVAMAASDKTPGSADTLLPVYLRLSQAERERQERMNRA